MHIQRKNTKDIILASDGVEYSTSEYEYRKKTSSTSTDIEKCTRVRVP